MKMMTRNEAKGSSFVCGALVSQRRYLLKLEPSDWMLGIIDKPVDRHLEIVD